ncbi:MAG: RNA polymerase factor sigma-54 [candidate division Zixibacteria bacterium]|nr:RNA polymerase factor sigma-54 [candidate division Zixibacteria bacterium]NIT51578.1 RNA polymerase factor sigma-54 [candidate division Zixibacteria bacterium]NIW39052.1 RNA polymerase factor sigma-54 [candidate division Zixibacteria bacterium]NIX58634.1 RNA polymerase factor sigma-54 [candidate division Zixibacteria bacterium]
MKLGLQLKLKQTLAPQMIQSLKMLQMPLLKLEQVLRHELSVNPMLEEEEVLEPEVKDGDEYSENTLDDSDPLMDPNMTKGDMDWEYYLGDDAQDYVFRRMKEKREEWQTNTPALEKTLYEHLLDQLSLLKLSDEEFNIGEFIIGNIDESGYLCCSPNEIAEMLEVEPEKVNKILEKIQLFDPPGVGAGSLKESLLIQLREKGLENSLAWKIIDQFFHELDRKSPLQLSKALNVPVERINEAMSKIKSLSPRPASGKFVSAASAVIPDLIVDKIDGEYVVYHNDKSVPRLRINSSYKDLLKRNKNTPQDTRKYVREKLDQARWLLNAINQRRSTMINVMHSIINKQYDFFERGPDYLKPMIMEDIARDVEMNVATISRVSNGKYVQTPQGVYEIKHFFNSGLQRENGEALTKRSVKQQIEKLISEEDKAKPLSDQEIHRKLNEEGIKIARRTVTKYREELKIQPARFRKMVPKENS